ncbi:hypothetical protein [Streptomyces sp. NPDC005953]|uniref:hypothetical protein n=1 Tax=Streptomyces sp. NPDC005953 TaxID=3156719 RepID=UPI00340F87A6
MTGAMAMGALALSGCSTTERTRLAASPTAITPTRSSIPPLTAEQLKALAFTESDVPQAHSVPVQHPAPQQVPGNPPLSDASCQRLYDVINAKHASASVFQIFNWKENVMGGDSRIASYEGTKAQEAFRQLQKALKTCKTFTGSGYTGKFTATITVEKAPDLGDEALSFHLTMPLTDGYGLRDEHHVFIRTGTITASFQELTVGRKAQFPLDLIQKQIDRLRSAQRGS